MTTSTQTTSKQRTPRRHISDVISLATFTRHYMQLLQLNGDNDVINGASLRDEIAHAPSLRQWQQSQQRRRFVGDSCIP